MARGAKRAAVEAGPVDGPWELPDGWRWERLGDLGDWYGGGTPSKANPDFWTDGTVPWVSAKDMKSAFIDVTDDQITDAAVQGSSAKRIPAGSVLCVMRSGILRHSFPVAVTLREVTINQDLRALKPREDINPLFVAHFLKRTELDILNECSKDGTTVNSIDTGRLLDRPVPLPCRDMQDQIVARIDELFAEIDGGELALAVAGKGVETYGKALLKSVVTGELTADWRAENDQEETGESLFCRILADRRARWSADPKNVRKSYSEVTPPDPLSLPSLPAGWAWTTVECLTTGDRGAVVIGPFGSDLKVSDYTDEGVPLVFVRHIRSQDFVGQRPQFVSPSKAKALKAHEAVAGDLLITKMGDPPGDVAIYPDHVPAIITADCIRWRPHPLLNNEFLAAWISSFWAQAWIAKHTKGVAQQKITLENFKSMPVALPGPNEQSAIVAAVRSGFAFAAEIGSLTDTSAATSLRQSILAAAFRGDLVA